MSFGHMLTSAQIKILREERNPVPRTQVCLIVYGPRTVATRAGNPGQTAQASH